MPTTSRRGFRSLLPALKPEIPGMLVSYLIGTISAMSLAAISVLTAWGVGQAVVEQSAPEGWWWFVMCGLVVVRGVLTWQEMDVSHSLAYRVLARLRLALFDSYARSIPARTREHSGRTASVVLDDIEKLEFFYAHTLAQIATSLTLFVASLTATTIVLPVSGLVLIVGAGVVGISALAFKNRVRALGRAERENSSELAQTLADALGALREVLAYGLVTRITRGVLAHTARSTQLRRRREVLTGAIESLRDGATIVVVIGVILSAVSAGSSAVTGGRYDTALLPALVAVALVGIASVADAARTLSQLHHLVPSAQRVDAALHRPAAVNAIPEAAQAPIPDGALGIRLTDVRFTYRGNAPVVDDWCGRILPGEHVGLRGPSGSGKSTLLNLIARLWDTDAGSIELESGDGFAVDIRRVADVDLRAAVVLVDQETTLFHGTIRENLLRGSRPVPDDRLREILGRVGASEWGDLDDRVGQHGAGLSGGQRARLCLARALVRKPRILLIDEVTASLDAATEAVISSVIAAFDGTVMVASHRQETLDRMDRVIHM